MIIDFKKDMMRRYKMNNMDLLHHFLCLEIGQQPDENFICQKKYSYHILIKFGMSNLKPMDTPLVVNIKLVKENGEGKIDFTLYIEVCLEIYYTAQLQG